MFSTLVHSSLGITFLYTECAEQALFHPSSVENQPAIKPVFKTVCNTFIISVLHMESTCVLLVLLLSQYCACYAPREIPRENTEQITPAKTRGEFPSFCFVLKAALLLRGCLIAGEELTREFSRASCYLLIVDKAGIFSECRNPLSSDLVCCLPYM